MVDLWYGYCKHRKVWQAAKHAQPVHMRAMQRFAALVLSCPGLIHNCHAIILVSMDTPKVQQDACMATNTLAWVAQAKNL